MTEQDIRETFHDIVVGEFGVPEAEYGEDVTFEAMGLDSLDLVELTLALEDHTGATIEDEELEEVRTPGDGIAKIADKLAVDA